MSKHDISIAVFVMSCDKTADVARHFIPAFRKYWQDCPYPIFFGINHDQSHLETLVATPLPSEVKGWRDETLNQLQTLRTLAPGVTHVLVFLDDFILNEKVITEQIQRVLSAAAAEKNIAYLRLRRLEESVLGKLKQHFMKHYVFADAPCFEVRIDHPYYSSLQAALWRFDHLYALIERSENIWAFERLSDLKHAHYSVLQTMFRYRHIVEKGQWDIGAEKYCKKAIGGFTSGTREMRDNDLASRVGFQVEKVKFFIFGYYLMRLKKRLNPKR